MIAHWKNCKHINLLVVYSVEKPTGIFTSGRLLGMFVTSDRLPSKRRAMCAVLKERPHEEDDHFLLRETKL